MLLATLNIFLAQEMDDKLVSMLKEPIRLPLSELQGNLENILATKKLDKTKDTAPNTARITDHPNIVGVEEVYNNWDNNATIAIKRLYASCMREGKVTFLSRSDRC